MKHKNHWFKKKKKGIQEQIQLGSIVKLIYSKDHSKLSKTI